MSSINTDLGHCCGFFVVRLWYICNTRGICHLTTKIQYVDRVKFYLKFKQLDLFRNYLTES